MLIQGEQSRIFRQAYSLDTSKAAMAKHIEFMHSMDNEPNRKSHPKAVYVFIMERPIPPKKKLTNT